MYKKNFQVLGYDSKAHRIKRYKQGKKALTRYYKNYQEQFTGHPVTLEKSFRFPIAGVPLIGRIDRVDILNKAGFNDSSPFIKGTGLRRFGAKPEDSITQPSISSESKTRIEATINQQFELIDYKTGQARDQKQVDRDAQLTIYAMAAKELFGTLPTALSLYFIDDGTKVTTTRTQAQVDTKKEEIAQTIAKIKKGNFKPTPGYPMPCNYCAYNQICPSAKRS